MKKHDEGYVMILVLVVMIVMGLVTASILTFSLRNLQNQQLSIERMADKYEAQGEMEKLVQQVVGGDSFKVADDRIRQPENEPNHLYVTLTTTSEDESATVTCVLKIISKEVIGQEEDDEGNKVYVFTDMSWEYASYKITYSNGETEEGGEGT